MKPVSADVDFASQEEEILTYWRENQIFKKSLEKRAKGPIFSFYDGPPFATGTPHYGHLLAGTIKDVVPRYFTMKGFYVERRFGWDCHGLPIEMMVEQELGLSGPADISRFGVANFNEACRSSVLKYEKEWQKTTERIGRWVDFENDYKTMDRSFMESVWWVFKSLWDKGLIYKSKRVMPYSWRLATPLSNFEAGLNYKNTQDPSLYVKYLVPQLGLFLVVWTTTPWTLLANVAIAISPKLRYAKVKLAQEELIVSESFARKSGFEYEIVHSSELVGLEYQPIFTNSAVNDFVFKIVEGDFIDEGQGTGLVHISPCYGEEDFDLGVKHKMPVVDVLDEAGNIKAEIFVNGEIFHEVRGLNFKEAANPIIRKLRNLGLLFKNETIHHSYPFCYRSETPLIYRAIDAWYLKVEDVREKLIEAVKTTTWVPDYVKDGRFGNWLAQARDWNISRNRFWGNPIPVWVCSECGKMDCIGSVAELETKSGCQVSDLHKHFVDKLSWKCSECGEEMRRVPEVLDCWFESGAMPFAQNHYPFENKDKFDQSFPADFIAEGIDQTRGWFYTLLVLGCHLMGKSPYKNVVVTGIVLAEDGKKMSKRLKNYPDPSDVIQKFGADALRLYLISSPVVRGDNLRFSEAGVSDIVRRVLLPLWNAYSFFVSYALIDKFKPSSHLCRSNNVLDQWIVSRLQSLISEVDYEMTRFRLYKVVTPMLNFLDDLCNWYIRRSRRRFWSSDSQDKQEAYHTLYYVLLDVSKVLASFCPFLSEQIYRNLSSLVPDAEISVHLCDFPGANKEIVEKEVEEVFNLFKRVVEAGRALRSRLKLKLRQPLKQLTIVSKNPLTEKMRLLLGDHIKDELNVKDLLFSESEEDLVSVRVRPVTPILGPRLGNRLKLLTEALAKLSLRDVVEIESSGFFTFEDIKIPTEHLLIERTSLRDDVETLFDVSVFFNTEIDRSLYLEMLSREFINRVQKLRKEMKFELTDRIKILFRSDDADLNDAVKSHVSDIKAECLALEVVSSDLADVQVEDIESCNLFLKLERMDGFS